MAIWNKWSKRLLLTLALLTVCVVVTVIVALRLASQKMQRTVDVPVKAIAFRSDAQALERGRYLYASRGCVDCHGTSGGGRMFLDDGKGLRIAGPNISPGSGSVVSSYTAEDWVRTIRHGVSPTGRPLMIMPSEDYNRLTDEDLASLVAYVRHLAPAQGGGPVLDLPLPVRAAYGLGLMRDAAAKIDHARPPEQPVPAGITAQHGAYVANMCLGCHGLNLAGGKIPGGPPDWPAASNLTPGQGSVMNRYPDADALMRLFQTGTRPDGTAVQVMPFESLREMNETDIRALHLYLKSLPARPHG